MAALTADDVITRFREEVGDTVEATYFVSTNLALNWVSQVIQDYSRYREYHTTKTLTVLADTTDYAMDQGVRRVQSIWDFTDGEEAAYTVPFEQFASEPGEHKLKITVRLSGTLPDAGTALRVYCVTEHTQPSSEAAELTVPASDEGYLSDLMVARYYRKLAQDRGAQGRWKVGMREEDHGRTTGELRTMAKELEESVYAKLRQHGAVLSAGYPHEVDGSPRTVLTGGLQSQGTYGWRSPGQRRRAP